MGKINTQNIDTQKQTYLKARLIEVETLLNKTQNIKSAGELSTQYWLMYALDNGLYNAIKEYASIIEQNY